MFGVSLPAVLNQVCLDDFRVVHIDDSAIGWDTEDPDLHFQPLFLFVDFNCLVESRINLGNFLCLGKMQPAKTETHPLLCCREVGTRRYPSYHTLSSQHT